ncbi:MAG: hypothetical protein JRF72_10105 [Deltaproteobacteria bacterium]|jgi:hypothetical protein|nr:hypothetical protein [Deltaproteobacteria bacterium]
MRAINLRAYGLHVKGYQMIKAAAWPMPMRVCLVVLKLPPKRIAVDWSIVRVGGIISKKKQKYNESVCLFRLSSKLLLFALEADAKLHPIRLRRIPERDLQFKTASNDYGRVD